MITTDMVKKAAENGLPGLKSLFEKLPKEDCLKGLGIMVILGVSTVAINTIKEIVMNK